MGFQVMAIKRDFINNGGKTTGVDLNNDKNQEYTLNYTENGYSFEVFDFNSDGNKDMDLYYDKDGKFVDGYFYDENGEIYKPSSKEVLSYMEQAQDLREQMQSPMFSAPNFEDVDGINDIQEKMLENSRKKHELARAYTQDFTNQTQTPTSSASRFEDIQEFESIQEEMLKVKEIVDSKSNNLRIVLD